MTLEKYLHDMLQYWVAELFNEDDEEEQAFIHGNINSIVQIMNDLGYLGVGRTKTLKIDLEEEKKNKSCLTS